MRHMRHALSSRALQLIAATVFAILAFVSQASAHDALPYSDVPFSRLFVAQPDPTPASVPEIVVTYQTPAQPPPEPEHTGFGALVRSTGSDFKALPRRKSTWVILGIGGAAAAIVYPKDDEINAHIQGSDTVATIFKPGKWLGYGWVQAGAAVTTYAVGRIMRHRTGHQNKVAHMGFDLVRANILAQSLTYAIKLSVRRDRPTGECCSFPSGHSSVTFAAASVLERHFGYRAAWPTFLIAGYVAASRMHDNRHFPSDVLFGAALGVASGWTVVGRHGRSQFALAPVKTPRGVMIALTKVNGSSSRK